MHAYNIYNITGTQIGAFTLIILFIYGTEVSRAYYGASLQIASVISYSSFLAFALYPKLLEKINQEDVTTSLKMVFRFAIPMTTGAIILADSYLTILIKVYNEATLVLQLLASNIICLTFSQVLNKVIVDVEKIDEKSQIPFKQLLKKQTASDFYVSLCSRGNNNALIILCAYSNRPNSASSCYFCRQNLPYSQRNYAYLPIYDSSENFAFHFSLEKLRQVRYRLCYNGYYIDSNSSSSKVACHISNHILAGTIYMATLLAMDKERGELVRLTIREIRVKLLLRD